MIHSVDVKFLRKGANLNDSFLFLFLILVLC